MARVAVIQRPPVLLDRAATLRAAVESVAEAARGGAQLVVFPEAFVPGYPTWIWRLRPGPDMGLTEAIHARLLAEAVDLAADHLAPLQQAAREHQVTIVCGIDECEASRGGTTLYNYMPLARYALYAQGLQLYVTPTYDEGERTLATMRHIAREGGCWVICCGSALHGRDLPDEPHGLRALFAADADAWINAGDSVVVAPGGKVVAGPLHEQHGILFADIDLGRVGAARRSLDVVGHYARPDVFTLRVQQQAQRPVREWARVDADGDDA